MPEVIAGLEIPEPAAVADLPAVVGALGLSVAMLTVIFAVYVAGLLGVLLTVGSLSDHLGRPPVPIAALSWRRPARRSSGLPTGWGRC